MKTLLICALSAALGGLAMARMDVQDPAAPDLRIGGARLAPPCLSTSGAQQGSIERDRVSRQRFRKMGLPDHTKAAALLAELRPLTKTKLSRLSHAWRLVLAMLALGDGTDVTPAERSLLLELLGGLEFTAPDAEVLSRFRFETVRRLAAHIEAVDPAGAARHWAVLLAVHSVSRGEPQAPCDALVATMTKLVAGRSPIAHGAWWAQFLNALPPGRQSLAVRSALYAAVEKRTPGHAYERVMRRLATPEDMSRPEGSFALAYMEPFARRNLPLETRLEAAASHPNVNWRRVALLSLPPEVSWPHPGHAAIGSAQKRQFADAIDQYVEPADSGLFYYRVDLLSRAWRLLGPVLAERSLRAFAAGPSTDAFETGLRIAVAAEAIAIGTQDATERVALGSAERSLRDLFDTHQRKLGAITRVVLQCPQARARGPRDVIIRALGRHLHVLDASLYESLTEGI